MTAAGGAARAASLGPGVPGESGAPHPPRAGGAGGGAVLALAVALLAICSAWPIYADPWIAVVAAAGAVAAFLAVRAGVRWRWGAGTVLALGLLFAALVVPVAVPSALGGSPRSLLSALGDGLAAVALGWKQILTLVLPLGTYQTVLVPLLVTVMVAAAIAVRLAAGGARAHACAALPLLAPLLFGTVLGPATPSEAIVLGAVEIAAPRELALWCATAVIVAAWIGWSSGRARRAALRLGGAAPVSLRRALRGGLGAGLLVVALAAGAVLAPAAATAPRTLPRDRVDPVLIVRAQSSPLSGYRVWKRDAALDAPIFAVSPLDGAALPERLRLAVLDDENGVDFAVTAEPGTFTRFPSGTAAQDPSRVAVELRSAAPGIWVPLPAALTGPPRFTGPRAAELRDGFYLDRETGAGIAVPTAAGLRAGDGFEAEAGGGADAELDPAPAHATPQIDRTAFPQLDRWVRMQRLPATGAGLAEAIERLRDRGYLSHALSAEPGERAWLDELAEAHGTRFVASAGGHSNARIEELFAQLADRETAAGSDAAAAELVAGIGDDEQFAVAAARLAEAFGYDARVVLGVRLDPESDAEVPGVPACAEVCAGRNIGAWVEARGADGVWAPLDVTPQVATPPAAITEGERLPEHPTVPEERDAHESDPELGAGAGDSSAEPGPEPASTLAIGPVLRAIGLGIAALALLALVLLFVPAVKALRARSRRRAASPELRALGAWEELVALHTDAGALPRAATGPGAPGIGVPGPGAPGPGAPATRAMLGASIPGGAAFAAQVDRAVFSRDGLTDAEADALWAEVDRARERLAGEGTRGARLRARWSLASFGIARRGGVRGGGIRGGAGGVRKSGGAR